MPLFPYDLLAIRDAVSRVAPEWAGVAIQGWAKYLGVVVGPEKGERSWNGPLAKYIHRARLWGRVGAGLHITTRAYMVYIITVLTFVAQLEVPPDAFDNEERKACRLLFKGPHAWILPPVLQDLKSLGFPAELVDLRTVAIAAKSRVCRMENRIHGGLHIHRRARRLKHLADDCDDWQRLSWVAKWLPRNFLFSVAASDTVVEERIGLQRRLDTLPEKYTQWVMAQEQQSESRRKCTVVYWQAVARSIIRQPSLCAATAHLRRRLDKFQLRTLPGHRVARAIDVCKRLNRLCAPRVCAAYIRTICDGWTTQARFQRRAPCPFGCRYGRDSLHHIIQCPKLQTWCTKHLALRRAPDGYAADTFLCMYTDCLDASFLMHGSTADEVLRARGLAVYAAYRLRNGIRHARHSRHSLDGAFLGYVREGFLASGEDA